MSAGGGVLRSTTQTVANQYRGSTSIIRPSQADSSGVAGSHMPNFKKALEEYDKKYTTLIDYFGIIAPSLDQIYTAIDLAKSEEKIRLTSQVLTRVPEIDKPSIAFPAQISDVSLYSSLIVYYLVLHIRPLKSDVGN